jgi:hypothetical protein
MRKVVHCFGTYDKSDDVCYGNKETGEEPCGLKEDCNPFTRYLKRLKKEPSEFFKYKEIEEDGVTNSYAIPKDGWKRFWKFVKNLSRTRKLAQKKKKKRKTRSDKKDGRRKPPTAKSIKASKNALKKVCIERRAKLLGVFEEFKTVLLEKLDGTRTFAAPGEAVVPGQFYITNKINTNSRYIGVFCRTMNGFDLPVVRLKAKTREMAFDVLLPVNIEDLEENFSKSVMKKLKPINEIEISSLKVEIKSVKPTTVVLISEIIARLIIDDIIDLPSMQ